MADLDPVDKGKVNEVVFDLLDHLDEWYDNDAEIGHLLVVVRVTDADGVRCTDVVTSPGTTKGEALEMLARAHDTHGRPAAEAGARKPKPRPWWRKAFGG